MLPTPAMFANGTLSPVTALSVSSSQGFVFTVDCPVHIGIFVINLPPFALKDVPAYTKLIRH